MQHDDVCNLYLHLADYTFRLLWCSLNAGNESCRSKNDLLLVPVHFPWTASTGLEEMRLKIERDESDMRRGSRVPVSVPGVLKPPAGSAIKI